MYTYIYIYIYIYISIYLCIDPLYDFRLLRKIADAPFTRDLDAFALANH